MKIKALIIDDNLFMQTLLKDVIQESTPYVEVLGTADCGKKGIEMIKKYQPDLIFLDVEMPDMTGFEMLEKLGEINVGTIFTTSHDQYAIKALKLEALDYLLKPVESSELVTAVEKFKLRQNNLKRNEVVKKSLDNLEALILNILPKEIATEIKKNGLAKTTKKFDSATVLFADIVDFSKHAKMMSSEDLVGELDRCYSAFDLIMEEFGIEKIKTIGDAYMAAGGVPVPDTRGPINTLKAAFAMQDYLRQYNIKRNAQNKKALEIRIGIHTGPVVAGVVGIKKFAYDIWGDTVNIAARMESAGEAGKINISHKTYKLLKASNEFSFTSRGKIEINGQGPLEMYFVEKDPHTMN